MKHYNLTLLSVIVLCLSITYVSAIYSGETITINSGLDNISGVVFVENTSAVGWNQISQSEINVTIPEDYTEGTFHIVFYGYTSKDPNAKEVIYVGGGGGGHTIYKNVTQNVTQYIPVTNGTWIEYRDRNITQIKYINNQKLEWYHYLSYIILISILGCLIYLIFKNDKGGKTNGKTNGNTEESILQK